MPVPTPIDSPRHGIPGCEWCPLNLAKKGLTVRVRKLLASAEVAHRLREIGFGEDQVVRLIAAQANVICLVCNARLALSKALAETILVEPVACP
jgi:Fe2+ transport system protein FeoA